MTVLTIDFALLLANADFAELAALRDSGEVFGDEHEAVTRRLAQINHDRFHGEVRTGQHEDLAAISEDYTNFRMRCAENGII